MNELVHFGIKSRYILLGFFFIFSFKFYLTLITISQTPEVTNILTHCKWYDVQFLCPKKSIDYCFGIWFWGENTYIFQVLTCIRSFFMKNTSFVVQKYYFSDKKKEGLFLQTLKKTLDIYTHVKVKILSPYARLNSIYKYIIRSKYLVKSYANIFLFLLAQMTKPSDNIYTTVRSLKSI